MNRHRWAIVAGAAAIFVGILWLIARGDSHGSPFAAANPPTSTQLQTAALPSPNHSVAAPANRNQPKQDAAIVVCGGREFPAGTPTDKISAALLRDPPSEPWLAALKSSTDERAQVAALYVEQMNTVRSTEGMVALPKWLEGRRRFLDQLTQLALHTHDPVVFAYAAKGCGAAVKDAPPGCSAYSPSDWAELDPDNGAAWADVADKARRDGDADAEAAAFARVATSSRYDNYSFGLLTAALPLMPNDTRPIDRYNLIVSFIGMESAAAVPSYQEFSRYCSAVRVEIPEIRDQCLGAAELMTSKGTSLLDLAVGIHVGERAGWSKSKVEKSTELMHAMMGALTSDASLGPDQFDCDHVNRDNAYVGQLGADGEVGALHRKLEQTGETTEEMARRYQIYGENLRNLSALENK
jgi:hypothetical protein